MIALHTFERLLDDYDGRLPLLTLAEFFEGNTQKDSLVSNQWGYGRPPLAEIWARLQKAAAHPATAWVRVSLHDDTEIVNSAAGAALSLVGDTIVLCTTASPGEIDRCRGLRWTGLRRRDRPRARRIGYFFVRPAYSQRFPLFSNRLGLNCTDPKKQPRLMRSCFLRLISFRRGAAPAASRSPWNR